MVQKNITTSELLELGWELTAENVRVFNDTKCIYVKKSGISFKVFHNDEPIKFLKEQRATLSEKKGFFTKAYTSDDVVLRLTTIADGNN